MHFVLEVFDLQLLWFPGDQCKRACESSSVQESSVSESHFLWDGPVAGDRAILGWKGVHEKPFLDEDPWVSSVTLGAFSKPRLKLPVGASSEMHSHGHEVWACLPILPAQKVSFGSCCPSLSSLEDFQQGNKKVFLSWTNIYITNIQCLCLVTNIPACKWEAFLGKGGTGNREVIHSYHCIC